MKIAVANRQRTKKIDMRWLKQVVGAILAELDVSEAELGIAIVGAAEMARVNWQFLQHEGSTDVITFDHANSGFNTRNSNLQIHGELFVCIDDAVQQAKQFKSTWPSEVVRYVIHGVLHLLGYDDMKPDLRRKMKREENRLMRWLEKRFTLAQLAGPGKIRA